MVTPEGKVKKEVIKLLDQYSHYRFMPVQFGFGKRTLDFLICFHGKFLAIETKAEGEELTMQQINIRNEIRAAGGTVLTVSNDEELKYLKDWLDARII